MTERPDLTQTTRDAWQTGQESLAESWRQAQVLWNNVAANWGEAAGMLMRQTRDRSQETAALRELQDAALAAGQAWLRLPTVLVGGAPATELPQAINRLAEAQGRALRVWLGTLTAR
jgi:hypothetical protein